MRIEKVIVSILLLVVSTVVLGQHEETNKEHKERGVYELISSGIYSYSFHDKTGEVGAEFHFTYWFNHKWGAGISYTAKFKDETVLNEIALLGSWNPLKWATVNFGPNFSLPSEHENFRLGAYLESEINIRPTSWFHFGPVIGTVYSEHFELNVGVHLGFEL
ncbi:MAG: hypothetical protein COA38_13455 [Fluviicola sp.]|nr:MAG: hypothetical protein COA38_13455 [Fluviicola sp.]